MSVFLLVFLGIVCSVMVLKQGFSRKVELLSIRNLYLAGFLLYQVAGPAQALYTGNFTGFRIQDPATTGRWLTFFVWTFFLVFLFSYHRIPLVDRLVAKLSGLPSEASDATLMTLAVLLVVIGLPVRIFSPYIPVIGHGLLVSSWSLAALAAAAAGWVWSQRKFNVVILSITAAVVAGCLAIAIFSIFGRRPLVGVVIGFAWGAYYRWARHVAPGKLILHMAPLVAFAFVVITAFTAIRSDVSRGHTTDVGSIVRAMTQADVQKGGKSLASGQAVPGAMLWAIESFPDYHEPKHLFSLRYMAMYFIPRQIWTDKPAPLSTEVANLAKLKGVNRDKITLPPGVVGYAAAEGGFYALVIYALFFGQFCRFFDVLIRANPNNPFIILPAGCVTGQFIGLARGDIATFTDIIVVSFISTMVLMFLAKFFFGRRTAPQQSMQFAPQV